MCIVVFLGIVARVVRRDYLFSGDWISHFHDIDFNLGSFGSTGCSFLFRDAVESHLGIGSSAGFVVVRRINLALDCLDAARRSIPVA